MAQDMRRGPGQPRTLRRPLRRVLDNATDAGTAERLRSLRPEEPAPEDPATPATRAPLSGGRFRRPGQDAGGEQRLIRPSGMLGGPLRRRMEPTDEAVAEPESVEPAEAVAPDAPPVNLAERPEPGGEIPTLSRRLRRADEAGVERERTFSRPEAGSQVTARRQSKSNPQVEEAKDRLHSRLIEDLDHGALEKLGTVERREAVIKAAKELIAQDDIRVPGASREDLLEGVADEVLGLGPIEPLLRDPDVSEVMVNDLDRVFFERGGRIFRAPVKFRDQAHIMRIIERIVSPLGRRIDESSPMVDARLADGSRVNITVPPASPRAPTITIRKFQSDKMKMADLIKVGALSEATAEFLSMCIKAHLNVIISGGTGTGKTTMLNALSAFIPDTERIITVEDPSELQLQQEHVITLEARPASIEGKNAVTQRDLVRNCLRMRPDRIIVGETRGSEAFDMLQAMNTGHDGSISTVHANTPRDAVSRLENMVLMAGMDLPARGIREQIASAIHVFIQLTRMQDGSRRVTHVTEVSGMEGDTITLQDIFLFKLDHVDDDGKVHGEMRPTGIRPGFASKFAMHGIEMSSGLFGTFGEW